MYTPAEFLIDDRAWQHSLMREHPFGALITLLDGAIEASHIPLLLDTERGPLGTLRGHVARANPIWRAFDGTREALAKFTGPHAYISPDWYATERLVPTWNYVAVHVYGAPRVLEGGAVLAVLRDLAAANEAGLAPKAPWTLERLPARSLDVLTQAIVAFEMPIARLQGKAKLSQNRAPEDAAGAIVGLRARGGADDLATAELMDAVLTTRSV